MRVRFPYPPATTVALLLVVLFAIGHTVYTSREVAALSAQVGPTADARHFVLAMYAMSLVLTAFVAVMLLYRSRLELDLGDTHLTMRRLHLAAAKRERAIAWDDLEGVVVRSDPRGNWHVFIDTDGRRRKYPLAHARVVSDDGLTKARRIRDRADAEGHPLVERLRERLGDRCRIR